jgi:tetratricopeptide (TPR) repeat protein
MSDRLHDFARAVAVRQAEQQQQDHVVDEATMKAIALELGMTEEDILKARAEGQAMKERARGLRQRGLIDDAITELDQASAWNPLDVEILTMLADCYVRRGRKQKSAADLEKGRQIALQALKVAPGNREAPQILQVIQMNPVEEGGSGVGVIAAVVAVAVVVAVVLGVIAAIVAFFVA